MEQTTSATNMTRICFFRLGATPLFVPNSTEIFGGAEVRSFTFAKALARQTKHEVSFAVGHNHRLPRRSPDGIIVRSMPAKKRGLAKVISSLRRRVSDRPVAYLALRNIPSDVIACFGVHDPTASVIEAARRLGKRSVLFLTSSEDVSEVSESAKQRRRTRFHRYAILQADEIVVQTRYQQQQLRQRFGRGGVLIRNPIDTTVVAQQLDRPREHVLWVGRADYDSKRADVCMSLARRCPDVPFRVVMNDGSPTVFNELLASKPTNVTLDRHVPLADIEALFATASVLINTSVSEGFPNAFLQAAKYGTPILSLNVDPDGMLAEKGCGEVAGDEVRMAGLISEYHRGSLRFTKRSLDAREYVQAYHELSDRVLELETVIENLTRQSHAA